MKLPSELVEGVKELLRTALMAVVPLLILGLQSGEIDWKVVWVAGLIALLSGLDKWLHKSEKGLAGNGLTGF